MKTIIYTLLFLITTVSFAQDSNLTPLVGNWEWADGTQTFRVELFINGDYLEGHYRMYETNTGNIIYKSNKLLNQDLNYYYGWAISVKSRENGAFFSGSIYDNVLFGNGIHSVKMGHIKITIQNSCYTCPITATWKVSRLMGIRHWTQPDNFTIPTDIVLTKID